MNEVLTVADASSSSRSTTPSPLRPLSTATTNLPLISAFLAFAIAQFLKVLTTWFKEKRWDTKRLLGSGGMPSSHSATVTALAVAIGLQEGTGGSPFALAVVFASIVMYDASGVRLHAGRQAELLNQIVCELPPEHPLSNVRPLCEPLGHTPLQVVAGALLGCIVSFLPAKFVVFPKNPSTRNGNENVFLDVGLVRARYLFALGSPSNKER